MAQRTQPKSLPNSPNESRAGLPEFNIESQAQTDDQSAEITINEMDASPEWRSLEPFLHGIEQQVRDALAEHMRRCPFLPPSLATTLVDDVVNAGRADASNGASLDRAALSRLAPALDGFTSKLDAEACQLHLPLPVIDHFITAFSAALGERLIEHHDLPVQLSDELAMHGRERALSRAMSASDTAEEIEQLVLALSARSAITPTLLLRGLCLGRLHFFASAIAQRANLPLDEAKAMIYDGASGGLLRLYEKSGLPPELFRAFRATIDIIAGLSAEQTGNWLREYTNRIIARLVSEYDYVCPEDLEHVLSQLSRHFAGEFAPPDPSQEAPSVNNP